MKMIILVGPPGSGKSTRAKQIIESEPDKNWCRLNQDSQGKAYKQIMQQALEDHRPIIVDRMNFNVKQRESFIDAARGFGYEVDICIVFENFETCLKRCMARQGHETIHSEVDATKAITFFFKNYEKPTIDEDIDNIYSIYPDNNKPKAVICDLDGTLCNIDHRKHYVKDGKKNWPMFFAGIENDKPNNWCVDLLLKFGKDHEIVFCSGRGEEYRLNTRRWLDKYLMSDFKNLYMRPAGDYRKDSVIKEMLLDFEILTRFTPYFVIDDRQQVVDMWRNRGYIVLQCDEGEF